MPEHRRILRPFATEMRHLTSALNVIASDMIRDRTLAKKLDDDPDYFRKNYTVTEEELDGDAGPQHDQALRARPASVPAGPVCRHDGDSGVLAGARRARTGRRLAAQHLSAAMHTTGRMTTWNIGSVTVTRVEEQLGITQPALREILSRTSNVKFWSAISTGSRPTTTACSTTDS